MARDISELGADVFDDTPKKQRRISPKKRNYIIGLSITGVLLIGVIIATAILCNTALTDYSNVNNVLFYFTQSTILEDGEEPYAVLYRLPSDVTFSSTFRIPSKVKGYKVIGVADRAFASHTEIKKVIMPSSIQFVGDEAFANCTNLKSFTWSKNLTDVGVDAFKNTAFYNNILKDSTSMYDLPSGILIYVGKDYFNANTALVSDSVTDAEISAIKANYTVDNVEKFSELNVNNICSGAFMDNDKITYIDLPESLSEISKSTFEGCSNLEAIDGSHTELTEIGSRAFANCSKLKDVSLPSSLNSLGDEAFENTGIEGNIPDLSTVESIGEYVFADCQNLKEVVYKSNTVPNYMFSGCSSLDTFYWGDTSNSNIDNVTEIGYGAFERTNFSSFVFPKNILTINDYVFADCESLETVSLYGNPTDKEVPPSEDDEEENTDDNTTYHGYTGDDLTSLLGVQSIKDSAFKNCTSLATINLYDDDYSVYEGNDNEFTFPYSLVRCDASTTGSSTNYTFAYSKPSKVTFKANMKSIGAYSFYQCTNLTNVIFEDIDKSSLVAIKTSAFEGCSNLVNFDLPSSVTRIETTAFSGCTSLKSLAVEDTKISIIFAYTYYNCQSLESLTLPDTVTSIKDRAFYRNYNLNYLVIPSSVTEILKYAITECRNVEGETMNVFFSRTISEASKINIKNSWCDDTVTVYYLLGEDEEKVEGYNYWKPNDVTGEPEII